MLHVLDAEEASTLIFYFSSLYNGVFYPLEVHTESISRVNGAPLILIQASRSLQVCNPTLLSIVHCLLLLAKLMC